MKKKAYLHIPFVFSLCIAFSFHPTSVYGVCTLPTTEEYSNTVFNPQQAEYETSDLVQMTCAEGSAGAGATLSICLNTGEWSENLLICYLDCAAPEVGPDVIFDPTDTTYSHGDTVTYSCTDEAIPVLGDNQATCADGQWEPSPTSVNPSCSGFQTESPLTAPQTTSSAPRTASGTPENPSTDSSTISFVTQNVTDLFTEETTVMKETKTSGTDVTQILTDVTDLATGKTNTSESTNMTTSFEVTMYTEIFDNVTTSELINSTDVENTEATQVLTDTVTDDVGPRTTLYTDVRTNKTTVTNYMTIIFETDSTPVTEGENTTVTEEQETLTANTDRVTEVPSTGVTLATVSETMTEVLTDEPSEMPSDLMTEMTSATIIFTRTQGTVDMSPGGTTLKTDVPATYTDSTREFISGRTTETEDPMVTGTDGLTALNTDGPTDFNTDGPTDFITDDPTDRNTEGTGLTVTGEFQTTVSESTGVPSSATTVVIATDSISERVTEAPETPSGTDVVSTEAPGSDPPEVTTPAQTSRTEAITPTVTDESRTPSQEPDRTGSPATEELVKTTEVPTTASDSSTSAVTTGFSKTAALTTTTPSTSLPFTTKVTIEPTVDNCNGMCDEIREVCEGTACVCRAGYQTPYEGMDCEPTIYYTASIKVLEINGVAAVFTNDLRNSGSSAFVALQLLVCSLMSDILRQEFPTFDSCEALTFSSGSIDTDLRLGFGGSTGVTKEAIKVVIDGVEDGLFHQSSGNYTINSNFTSVAATDECELDLHDCSPRADCVDLAAQAYTCRCWDGYMDNSPDGYDGRNCASYNWKLIAIVVGSCAGGLLLASLVLLIFGRAIVRRCSSPKTRPLAEGTRPRDAAAEEMHDKGVSTDDETIPWRHRDPDPHVFYARSVDGSEARQLNDARQISGRETYDDVNGYDLKEYRSSEPESEERYVPIRI